MHQTIEAVIYPDGRIVASESLAGSRSRRALLVVLDEPVVQELERLIGPLTLPDQVDLLLREAGLLDSLDDVPRYLRPFDEGERVSLAALLPAYPPLGELINDEREERL